MISEDLAEKKLRGSGGYAIARITDDEQKKGNLGGPELFLAGIGRLGEDRFSKYYCNKCEKEYEGSPAVLYENPNEELGEGVTLIEKGEYKCKTCNGTIAQYRKFDVPKTQGQGQEQRGQSGGDIAAGKEKQEPREPQGASTKVSSHAAGNQFVSIQSLVGMPAYDSDAIFVGTIKEIGLRKLAGGAGITIKIGDRDLEGGAENKQGDSTEIPWSGISKIGDIVLLGRSLDEIAGNGTELCPSCGNQNEAGAVFCEQCGTRLVAAR